MKPYLDSPFAPPLSFRGGTLNPLPIGEAGKPRACPERSEGNPCSPVFGIVIFSKSTLPCHSERGRFASPLATLPDEEFMQQVALYSHICKKRVPPIKC